MPSEDSHLHACHVTVEATWGAVIRYSSLSQSGGVFIDGGLAGALTHKSSGAPSQGSTEATWGRWVAKPTWQ